MDNFKGIFQFLLIIVIIFLAVVLLVWIDKDTEEWSQVFGWRLVNGILFYGFPSFVFVYYLFKRLKSKIPSFLALTISLIVAIPFTFITMILLLLAFVQLFK